MTLRRTVWRWVYDGWGPTALGFVIIVGSLVAAVVSVCFGIGYRISSVSCEHTADHMNVETRYDFWGDGCYVQVGDDFVPLDQVRITEDGVVIG